MIDGAGEGGSASDRHDLAHHGDRDRAPGAADFAVNVLDAPHPRWLLEAIRAADIIGYPDASPAIEAVAARHGRPAGQVLVTNGAAEAFVLIARALRVRRAAVVHPQFTEPELALRHAGVPVDRVVLPWPFALDVDAVPESADLVLLGNPTNPTSVLHPREAILALRRPGRLIVVDEAFADCVPGEPHSLAGDAAAQDVIVVRSLTKLWGLAGLRIGYVLAAEPIVARLRRAQPLWSVNAPALAACIACCGPDGQAEGTRRARLLQSRLTVLRDRIDATPGLQSVPDPRAPFVLVRTGRPDIRALLLRQGVSVRRGETFPGLGPTWFRAAARDGAATQRLIDALTTLHTDAPHPGETDE